MKFFPIVMITLLLLVSTVYATIPTHVNEEIQKYKEFVTQWAAHINVKILGINCLPIMIKEPVGNRYTFCTIVYGVNPKLQVLQVEDNGLVVPITLSNQ